MYVPEDKQPELDIRSHAPDFPGNLNTLATSTLTLYLGI